MIELGGDHELFRPALYLTTVKIDLSPAVTAVADLTPVGGPHRPTAELPFESRAGLQVPVQVVNPQRPYDSPFDENAAAIRRKPHGSHPVRIGQIGEHRTFAIHPG